MHCASQKRPRVSGALSLLKLAGRSPRAPGAVQPFPMPPRLSGSPRAGGIPRRPPAAQCSPLAPWLPSLSLRCVAWSRGAGHALPDVTALSNRPTARLPRTRAPRTSGCEPGRELGSQSWESCSAGHQLSRAAAMSSDDSSLMVRERWAACARASSAAKTALP